MTTDSNFFRAGNAITLSECCAASLRANGRLMASLLTSLPKSKVMAIEELLMGGGSVGIETLIDKHAANKVLLICIEREGRRLVLAEANTVQGSAVL